ncbi:Hypothetical predicted protein, partial [Scomber scombrus]
MAVAAVTAEWVLPPSSSIHTQTHTRISSTLPETHQASASYQSGCRSARRMKSTSIRGRGVLSCYDATWMRDKLMSMNSP